jgi:hypothetical protein
LFVVSQTVTAEEKEQLDRIILTMSGDHLIEALEELARREIALLRTELGGTDFREITLGNIAVLCAAIERLKPGSVDLETVTQDRIR